MHKLSLVLPSEHIPIEYPVLLTKTIYMHDDLRCSFHSLKSWQTLSTFIWWCPWWWWFLASSSWMKRMHTHMHAYYTYIQLFLGSLLQISHMIDEVQLFYMHFSGTQSWQEFYGNYLKISISKLSPRRCSFRNVCFMCLHTHTCMYIHHTYTFICIFPNVCEVICGTANSCFKCRAAASGLLELNLLQLRERSQKQQAARRPTNSRPTRVTPSLYNT